MQLEMEEEIAKEKEARREKKENLRKRRQNAKAPEKTEEELAGYSQIKAKEFTDEDAVKPVKQKTNLSGGFWTDEDLTELVRLVKKYPGGAGSRWEIIAEAMNRSVTEVTFMAAKMKENGYRIPGQPESVAETIVQEATVKKDKVKKTGNTIHLTEANWSQEQQQALESAIVQYRKSGNADRWQKIANSVQGKTKEECLLRYKYLCELVKSQKSSQAENKDSTDDKPVDSPVEDAESAEPIVVEEGDIEETQNKGKKRNKRRERRRKRDFSSGEDSDDLYEYE